MEIKHLNVVDLPVMEGFHVEGVRVANEYRQKLLQRLQKRICLDGSRRDK